MKNDLNKRIISIFAAACILLSLFSSSQIAFSEERGHVTDGSGIVASAGDAGEDDGHVDLDNNLSEDKNSGENDSDDKNKVTDNSDTNNETESSDNADQNNKEISDKSNSENSSRPNREKTNSNNKSDLNKTENDQQNNSTDNSLNDSLYEIMSDKTKIAELSVLTTAEDSAVEIKTAKVKTSREGLEVIKGYTFETVENTKGDADEQETLWVKTNLVGADKLENIECISLYSIENNKLSDVIVEDISLEKEPVELASGVTGIALVKDTGFRHIQFEIDANETEGENKSENQDVSNSEMAENEAENETDVVDDNGENSETDTDNKTIKEIIDIDSDSDDLDASDETEENTKDKIITLNGMMPKEATAEAIDVTEDYSDDSAMAIDSTASDSTASDAFMADASMTDAAEETSEKILAAYDISIIDGDDEYQPDEKRPISVEIIDSRIVKSDSIKVWHIKDNGEKEEVKDFTVEDGKVSFDATGFSVYEIVVDENVHPITSDDAGWKKLTNLVDFDKYLNDGFYICWFSSGRFITNQFQYNLKGKAKRSGLKVTETDVKDSKSKGILSNSCNYDELISNAESAGAARYYFEKSGAKYYIYCYDGDDIKYVASHKETGSYNSLKLVDNKTDASLYSVSLNDAGYFNIYYSDGTSDFKWNYAKQNNQTQNGVGAYDEYSDDNNFILWYYVPVDLGDDPYKLNGKTYGLMNYTGGTHGYALMGEGNVHSLIELVTHHHDDVDSLTLYVDEGSEISRWTFHSIGSDKYKLSVNDEGITKYLAVDGNSLILVNSVADAAEFKVNPGSDGKIQIAYGKKYINFSMTDDGESTKNIFSLSTDGGANSWLNLLGFASLTDDDFITYSADRVSVSDVQNGQKVIVYTRIWDEVNKKYDMYAINYNGELYPCYASGGKILWLGDGTGSLEWEFTEYVDEITKEPNYYYELFNPYSEKYIAPQITKNQVLSDNTIGINMQGRRNGEFYSEIVAWDNTQYAYIGMKPSDDKKKLVPCSQSTSVPFYFATLEPLNLSDKLHEVDTVDNKEHGITMKMFNFGYKPDVEKPGLKDTTVTADYFDGDFSNKQGLLENSLVYTGEGDVGYPTVKSTQKSFRDMYAGAEEVNKLFIESVYNSGGYFEFDSCQNFATLNGKTGGDFTVYRELGTVSDPVRSTLKHGQFLPYNNIEPQKYATGNIENIYNMDALASNGNIGVIDESDPRKYERLLNVKNPDYFFGMEMSASFVQTVSGLDAWGHDIVFDFTGDDDFWLYVDGELVLDLGGTHSAEHGRVNFRTGEIVYSLVNSNNTSRTTKNTTLKEVFEKNYKSRNPKATTEEISAYLDEIFEDNGSGQYIFKDYTTHTMRVFYMERGAGASNLHMRFNIASVTPGHVVVSKTISGPGADLLDKGFLEYPFQIYYTLPEGENGEPGEEQLLANDAEHIRVTYQNSNQPVTFVKKYRPPGYSEAEAFENIYFINPTKNAEISFPDETITYRIVECAVDSTVYGNVTINGDEIPSDRIEIKGDFRSYSSEPGSAEKKPNISFDNHVNDDVIKDLYITKKLLDENDEEIKDDPATFSFRLYISSVNTEADEIPLANMYSYYVLSPGDTLMEKKLCKFDSESGTFVATNYSYGREIIDKIDNGEISGLTHDDITFTTSGFGAISGIPAGYTICVPGLPVGSVFKVTEDVKTGYGLVGYERVMGTKVKEDGTVEDIPSYHQIEGQSLNVGRVIIEESPQVEVHNKRGYSLTANKKWSDVAITTGHDPIYVAVYVDGVLLENSLKKIESPSTSAYYFWTTLKSNSDGSERTDLSGYTIKEIEITSGTPTTDSDGNVTNINDLTFSPLETGDKIKLNATRTKTATPENENAEKNYDYIVTYEPGVENGSSRTDTITNTREGGIAIRLFKWDSVIPLKGGTFTLTDEAGKEVGKYTSDAEGLVTMMYSFEHEKLYTLTQTSAPDGYVGLKKKIKFKVNSDETVTLYYEDGVNVWGTPADSEDAQKDKKWAESKPGSNGITAFVDLYNKPFNFKIEKMDSSDVTVKLGAAHFALYKQVNTTVNGLMKQSDPLTGFEDMITVNGAVDICGGNSKRVLRPGEKGSVYFLTETQAPLNYDKLKDDIIFKISPLGFPSLISDSYNGNLLETEDGFVYTLSVPNKKLDASMAQLSITKKVTGNMGNKTKEFEFTFSVEGDDGTTDTSYEWTLNGVKQENNLKSGGTSGKFTMMHGDVVSILIPVDSKVTISEDSQGYKSSFKVGNAEPEDVSSKEIEIKSDTNLEVTNSYEGLIPTGVETHFMLLILSFIGIVAVLALLIRNKRKLQQER